MDKHYELSDEILSGGDLAPLKEVVLSFDDDTGDAKPWDAYQGQLHGVVG